MRKNNGFTLVELLVVIAVSSTVLLAAASLMLMGVRIGGAAREEAGEQQTVRTVFSVMEEMAASGDIYRVEPLSDGWQLRGRDSDGGPGAELLRYEDGSLYLGGAVLLDGLRGAGVEVPGDSGLLTFTFRTAEDTYSASVYCRTGVGGDSADSQETEDILDKVSDSDPAVFPKTEDLTPEEKAARYAFLQKLAGQVGSTGQIIGGDGTYFSQWYIGASWGQNGWGPDTPWCACFLSWAAVQSGAVENPPYFANVDTGMAGFQTAGRWADKNDDYIPIPGDYIFFDWGGGSDPAHVGAVLYVENGWVYTIEGNSGGRVAVQRYALSDPRIVGYGLLDWT